MLQKCLYVLQEVRTIIHFWQFIHPLSLHSRGNGTSFAFWSYIIKLAKFCNVTFLNIAEEKPRQNVFSYSYLSILFAVAKNAEIQGLHF